MIVINARFLTQQITGVQRFAIEISLKLKETLGSGVVFVSPHNILQKEYAERLEAKVIGKHTGHVWEQIDLPQYLSSKEKPLLLNLANTAPLFYKNKAVTVHDLAFEAYPQTFSKKFLYVYKFMIPRIIKSSKHVFTVSEFSKREICEYYHSESDKISVIYNAVGDKFQHKEVMGLRMKNYFLAVSSLNYRKNFIAVLKAFELYAQKNPEGNLYVIGEIKNANFKGIDITPFLHNSRIKFLGRVPDEELVKYYSNATGFIYPSIYEGFGIPPLEAQACGCPVLLSDIPPLKEVFQDSALYCNPHDIKDMALQIDQLSHNKEKYVDKGFQNIKRFSWETSALHIQ